MVRMANFSFVRLTARYVVLADNGPWDKYPSITNSAEEVIEYIRRGGQLDRKVYYYDSGGEFGELKHDGYKFTGFGHADRDTIDKEA